MVSIESNPGYLRLCCISPITGNTFASLFVQPAVALFYHNSSGVSTIITPELGANLVDLIMLCDYEKFPCLHLEYLMSRLFKFLLESEPVDGMRSLPEGTVYTPQAMWEMLNLPMGTYASECA